MAKYAGLVGYAITEETHPGIWEPVITEKMARGDLLRLVNTVEPGDKVNDNVSLNNRISIVADAFTLENFQNLKYAVYLGVRWKVISVEVQRPRLVLTLGGEWNG